MQSAEINSFFPEDKNNVSYFSKKWGVKPKQIHDAILHTGSLDPTTILRYIRKDSLFHHPVKGLKKAVEATVNYIF